MNVQLIMAVVISTVTTLLGRITVPVTVAGGWILMNILAMVTELTQKYCSASLVILFICTNICIQCSPLCYDQMFFFVHADTNECIEQTSGCDQICRNTPGSYYCECLVGYRLHTDNHTCNGTQKQHTSSKYSVKMV